jgi:hypothetical protein
MPLGMKGNVIKPFLFHNMASYIYLHMWVYNINNH